MPIAKLFKNGSSQAVRLPKEFRMPGKEVQIEHFENFVILKPVTGDYAAMFRAAEKFDDNFMADGRQQPEPQIRDEIN